MRGDEMDNEEERRGFWPIEKMKGKQDRDPWSLLVNLYT
jgi:hypothetical protein